MSLNASEFNRKYKLNTELASKIKLNQDDSKKQNGQVAGKPKKLLVEIFKRFFTNPVVVIALLAFIVVLLMSLLVPIFSAKEGILPAERISPLAFTDNLPSKYSPYITKVMDANNPVYRTYMDMRSQDAETVKIFNQYGLSDIKRSTLGNQYILTYNAFDFYKLNALNGQIYKWKADGVQYTSQMIADYWNTLGFNTILGTTTEGFDVWTRTWYATWRAIKIALIVAIVQAIIGISIGAYLGFKAGSWIDTLVMRLIDIFESAPTLIWILIFLTVFGPTQWTLIFTLSLVGWPSFVGITRMYVITVKNEEYIAAAKAIGAKTRRQVFVHALPAVIGKLAYSFVRSIPGIILWVASLAFLGFFKEANDTNLGQLLISASHETSANIWILVLPALILLTLSLSLSFVALGLHDALDPRVMSKRKRK